MVSHGVRRRFAGSGGRRIGAYLRMLAGRPRGRPDGLCTLRDELAPRLRGVVADAIGVDASSSMPPCRRSATTSPSIRSTSSSWPVQIEDAFDVALPERELGAVTTFGDLLAVVTALVACRMRARDAARPRWSFASATARSARFSPRRRTRGVRPRAVARGSPDDPGTTASRWSASFRRRRSRARPRAREPPVRTCGRGR
jgi:hypothetical protein